MLKRALISGAAVLGAVMLFGPSLRPSVMVTPATAQGTLQTAPQSVQFATVELPGAGTGMRASKIIGSAVVNEAHEPIGRIDDLIVSQDDATPLVVLSIGGFLGMGSRLVLVPYQRLTVSDNKVVLPGVSRAELKTLNEFRYATE